MIRKAALSALALLGLCLPAAAQDAVVARRSVDDRKAVIATVEPIRELKARARIGGTVMTLTVREGDAVQAGQQIANVVDPKLALQMQALESRIEAQASTREQAQIDYNRTLQLRPSGAVSQASVDQARTRLDAAERLLRALQADREVVGQQSTEGAVLAPASGRILGVPIAIGSVVMAGETIATMATDNYILRLQLPERHARFMKAGDTILVGARGLQPRDQETLRRGTVRLVYPQIDQGRVIADAEVEGLGDYFVGERTRVYVATGQREALVVPEGYVYQRFGVSYLKLKSGEEIVVQAGLPVDGGVEILAGVKDGDIVVRP